LNLGFGDRITRLVAGLGFVVFDYISSAQWEMIFLVVGLWSVTTSVVGHCPFSRPVYSIFGIQTCKLDPEET
jgi:hypothetical protein